MEACYLSKMRASVGLLNLIGVQQLNNLVHMSKGKNMYACNIQCSVQSKCS